MSYLNGSISAFFRAHSTSNQTLSTGAALTLGQAYNTALTSSNSEIYCDVSYVYGEIKSTASTSNLFDLDFTSRTTRQAQGWQMAMAVASGLAQDDGTYAVVSSGSTGLFVENMITSGDSASNQCRIYGVRLKP